MMGQENGPEFFSAFPGQPYHTDFYLGQTEGPPMSYLPPGPTTPPIIDPGIHQRGECEIPLYSQGSGVSSQKNAAVDYQMRTS